MATWSIDTLAAAHKHSIYNAAEIKTGSTCGCFYCQRSFQPNEILDWVDEENAKGATALCPNCDIDSVIGSESGHPVNDVTFLSAMHSYYF